MDQNNQQSTTMAPQQEAGVEKKKHMNGSSKNTNGKCVTGTTEDKKVVANGNGVHKDHQETNNHSQQETNNHSDAGATGGNEDANLLPHLESIERLMKLPVVEATWHQSQDVYGKVKGKSVVDHVARVAFTFASDAIEGKF